MPCRSIMASSLRSCALRPSIARAGLGVASRREGNVAPGPMESLSIHIDAGMLRCGCRVGAGKPSRLAARSGREENPGGRACEHSNSGELLNPGHDDILPKSFARKWLP